MSSAFSIALSGMNAESAGIDVVSNNLANINTTGYKDTTADFYDLISQAQGASAQSQVGLGVGTPDTEAIFSQGALQTSQSPLAVAIQGQGFLIAQSQSGNGTLYTRDGDLTTNSTGYLMTANGDYVQGWSNLNGAVNTAGPIGNIVVPTGSLKAPAQTTEVSLTANLDSTDTMSAALPPPANYSTSMTVYDSLGNPHTVDLYFTRTANPNEWSVTADLDGPNSGITAQVSGGSNWVAGTSTPPALLDFTTGGTLPTTDTVANPNVWTPLTITLGTTTGAVFTPGLPAGTPYTIGSGGNGTLALNLTDSSGNPTITQYDGVSGVSADSSDGNTAVNLTSVDIGTGGGVVATYSDGTQVTVGQLAMANFQNPDSLLNVGNNEFQATGQSSQASVGLPNNGGRGQILGGELEASTVDIATEFTNLLVYQQGYDANSKVVTTADQMSQDVINLIQ
jgi:flagellar hook protein FlgE